MRWAVIDRKEEKWSVRTARVFAWLLGIPYAVLWIARIVGVITEAPAIYYWLSKHTLQEFLDGPALFIILALVPDLVVGLPTVLLFGFVKAQTKKKEPNQAAQTTPGSFAPLRV